MEDTKICGEVVSSGTGKKDGHACFNNKPCAIHDTNTLREEFEANFLDGNKIEDCKGTTFSVKGALEISEYFYNKFNQKLEEIEREIEKEREFRWKATNPTTLELAELVGVDGYNQGLDLALQIIKKKKN